MDSYMRLYIGVFMAAIIIFLLFTLCTKEQENMHPLQSVEVSDTELENWQKKSFAYSVDVFFEQLVLLVENNFIVRCIWWINKEEPSDEEALSNILDFKESNARHKLFDTQ